jgi:PEP-CTERM motif
VKILRCCLILILLGLSSSAALANGIPDPGLGVKGGTGSDLWPGSVTFTIDSTTAICNPETGCDFTSGAFFINTGTITSFDFSFDTTQGTFTALADSVFPNIQTIVEGSEAVLSGGTILPPACSDCTPPTPGPNQIFGDFYFEMHGVTLGSNGITKVTVTSPEPGTMILMLSGLGAMGLRRLRRNKVPS